MRTGNRGSLSLFPFVIVRKDRLGGISQPEDYGFRRRRKNKKRRAKNPALGRKTGNRRSGLDDGHAAVRLVEQHRAVLQRKERPIATGADVLAGMELGAALADDDAAGGDGLAAKCLYAEALAGGIATVA